MEITGAVVGVLSLGIQTTQCLVHYYTSVKDSKIDTTRTVKKLNYLFSILQGLHNNIRNRKFRPNEQQILQAIESAVRECEGYIHELHDEAKKFSESPPTNTASFARTAFRRLAYPFRESTLLKLAGVIDKLCSHLSLALHTLQLQDLTCVEKNIRDNIKITDSLLASRMSADIREWLKAPDASVQYNETIKKRYPNTGNWFVDGPEFSNWLVKPNSFLWLNGFPGCGKSVLSSNAIQRTLTLRHSNSAVGVGYFYFTFNDASKQNTSSILRSLILQFINQLKSDNPALGQLSRLRNVNTYANPTPSDPALLSVLRTLIRQFDNVYIILDGLDESPRKSYRGHLLDTIQEIRDWSDSRLHLLVASRDEPGIRDYLHPANHEDIKIKSHFVNSDIEAFITGYLRSSRRLQRLSQFHPLIQEVLTSKAEGSFRWVECQLNALESCPANKTRVDSLLASLPHSLSQTYECMLLDIDEDLVKDARKVLTLLCTAPQPLTISELTKALRVNLGAEDILRICPGLVVINQNTMRLAHSSLRQYLQSEQISQSRASRFHVGRLPAQRIATRSW
ncbi:hypothetical protein QBC36DRAFT_324068 [Triangularia setosa]|uniref:NACHT domain-containing protein n=1 Tax=Triangularia setosa TaxID=2587417 RepID=A0AAN6WBK6_9PEZI|nr:hypothetical protein QBC36DRAFT_324068 [Podospora setosa]